MTCTAWAGGRRASRRYNDTDSQEPRGVRGPTTPALLQYDGEGNEDI